MSAGEIQLAALGMQDVHLTGSPKITYFLGVYRRHTPFSVQSFNTPFQDQNISWGSLGICRIPYKGDMIQSMTLAVVMPALFPYTPLFRWWAPGQILNPQPYMYINGLGPYYTLLGVSTFFTVGTVADPPWIGTALSPYVSYSTSLARFIISGSVTKISIAMNDIDTVAVFWGLDPHAYSSTSFINDVEVKNWTFKNGGQTNFTTIESGWVPYSPQETRLTNSLFFTGGETLQNQGYINFKNLNVVGYSIYMAPSTGGFIQFAYPGSYALLIEPVGIGQPTGVGIGHTSFDAVPYTPNYDYFYSYAVQLAGANPRVL
jgi:hypothetical protein